MLRPPVTCQDDGGRERTGIRPKVAQTLARHSDIRLTLNVYTHAELSDQTAAIAVLPGPPTAQSG